MKVSVNRKPYIFYTAVGKTKNLAADKISSLLKGSVFIIKINASKRLHSNRQARYVGTLRE